MVSSSRSSRRRRERSSPRAASGSFVSIRLMMSTWNTALASAWAGPSCSSSAISGPFRFLGLEDLHRRGTIDARRQVGLVGRPAPRCRQLAAHPALQEEPALFHVPKCHLEACEQGAVAGEPRGLDPPRRRGLPFHGQCLVVAERCAVRLPEALRDSAELVGALRQCLLRLRVQGVDFCLPLLPERSDFHRGASIGAGHLRTVAHCRHVALTWKTHAGSGPPAAARGPPKKHG